MQRRKIVFLFLLYLVLLSGCAKENDRSPVIARVGHSALTLDELVAIHPDTSDLIFFEDQIRSYVYRWVDREILYQAAVEQNLEQNPDIQRELERLKRDLVIQYFLEKNLKAVDRISEDEIKAYYQQHQSNFIRDFPEYRYYFLICKDRKTANRLKREIRKGKTFEEIVAENYPDAVENQTWDSGIVRLEAVIPALRRVIPKLKPGSLYGPVISDGNAFLIRLVEKYEANTVRDLALVRNEIIQRLKENHYREQYQKLLVSLKNKKHIDLNFDLLKKAISDTLVEDGS